MKLNTLLYGIHYEKIIFNKNWLFRLNSEIKVDRSSFTSNKKSVAFTAKALSY